ncbi:MAG: PhnD/SsuA/transferrin family substrate-binding protein [Sulfurimonas sp.]|jgi:phosphate/phosphite/phosphonate ABC transporter binding protein|nr:PhnD/SsuA/transferrin family substrate-binding protein [Sulfurimonas sp.]
MLLRLLFFSLLFFSSLVADELVKIGVLAHRGIPIILSKYKATAEYLTKNIEGYQFEIVPLGFDALKKSVKNQEIDFVLTNTMYYVELEYLYGVSRIATLKNLSSKGDDLTSFGGVILAKKKSDLQELTDLKGKRFGAVDKNSFGGWVMVQKELKDKGIEVEDFASFHFFGSHDRVVIAIRDGEIDAGTVRTDTLERMESEGLIAPGGFKVVGQKEYSGFPFLVSTRLYPEWPFAKLAATSQELSDKVLVALLQMPSDAKAAKDANVAGWTIALDYTSVHKMLEELHLGPYKDFGRLTLERFYEKHTTLFYGVLNTFLLILAVLFYIYRLNIRLKESQEEIESLNTNLENKVHARTSELKELYLHEKYLKNILKTTADINELLITSISTKNVLRNSMHKLIANEHYQLVCISLKKENLFEVVAKSFEDKRLLGDRSYPYELVQDQEEQLLETRVEQLPHGESFQLQNDSYQCPSCWVIKLPIRSTEDEEKYGVLSVFSTRENGFEPQEINILENLATDIGLTLGSIYQKNKLEYMELEKIANYEETILAFVNIIEQRDSYTAGHTLRVAQYCTLLAEPLGLSQEEMHKLEKAAILHDIGKVVTPDSILLKPGNLSDLEYELIKEHADAGYKMLSKINMYQDLAEIIKYHHARYDGDGYPQTSDPDAIPFLSHIMAVADAFDAMTTTRIYKPRKTPQEAIDEIEMLSGAQFHPDVAKVAKEVFSKIELVDTTQMPKNELEQRRFAYFFMDSLTEAYNENYLQIVLLEAEKTHETLVRIELNGFTAYNKEFGWDEGNMLLVNFARVLKENYGGAMLFRYHGDNFVLLFKEARRVSDEEIELLDLFGSSTITTTITHYNLKNGVPQL